MILLDERSGLFAYERDGVLVQLWNRLDYFTAGTPGIEGRWRYMPAVPFEKSWEEEMAEEGDFFPADPDFELVGTAWAINEKSGREKIEPDSLFVDEKDFDSGYHDDGGLKLVLMREFPKDAPDSIKRAIRERERIRLAAYEAVTEEIERVIGEDYEERQPSGQIAWVSAFGQSFRSLWTGKFTASTGESLKLEKADNMLDKRKEIWIDFRRIAAIKVLDRKRGGPQRGEEPWTEWVTETEKIAGMTPQLWEAICDCGETVKLPWREFCPACEKKFY